MLKGGKLEAKSPNIKGVDMFVRGGGGGGEGGGRGGKKNRQGGKNTRMTPRPPHRL